ncbi:MAG: hypothetical protein IJN26_07820 [Bacteroidales bacterium]|nr:hypothetical protein [Bacteroidales bacterium]
MKNDIFNFRRFGKYFTTDFKTCWANYGLSLLTISLLSPLVLYVIIVTINQIMHNTWDGPDIGLRVFAFAVAMICMVVTMPVKCYGKITEKQYGSFWLTLPASRLEKFISMILMTCIIVPVSGALLYLGLDALICAFDHTCGQNLFAGGTELLQRMGEAKDVTLNLIDESITIEDATLAQEIVRQMNNPWMYIDEIFCFTLPFLLGAVFFRNGKTVKTFIALFAISTVTGMICSPIMTNWVMEMFNNLNEDPDAILQMFNNKLFKNLVLIDTVTDTVTNLALMAGIWFRIKTLKH